MGELIALPSELQAPTEAAPAGGSASRACCAGVKLMCNPLPPLPAALPAGAAEGQDDGLHAADAGPALPPPEPEAAKWAPPGEERPPGEGVGCSGSPPRRRVVRCCDDDAEDERTPPWWPTAGRSAPPGDATGAGNASAAVGDVEGDVTSVLSGVTCVPRRVRDAAALAVAAATLAAKDAA